LLRFALIAPQACLAHRRPQFPGFCVLLARNRERTFEIRFRFRGVRQGRYKRDFSGNAMDFGLAPRFLGCCHKLSLFRAPVTVNRERGVAYVPNQTRNDCERRGQVVSDGLKIDWEQRDR